MADWKKTKDKRNHQHRDPNSHWRWLGLRLRLRLLGLFWGSVHLGFSITKTKLGVSMT